MFPCYIEDKTLNTISRKVPVALSFATVSNIKSMKFLFQESES